MTDPRETFVSFLRSGSESIIEQARLLKRDMQVGLNLIFLVPGETGGMEVAARELVPALRHADASIGFTAFVNRELAAELDRGKHEWLAGTRIVSVPVNGRRREQWVAAEQLLLPRAGRRAGIDLMHSLGSTAPSRGNFRRVVTIWDLNYKIVPEAHLGLRGYGMRVLVPLAARRSHRVIATSQSTRSDLVELLGVPEHKIDVAPAGVGVIARDQPMPEAELRASQRLGDRPFVLYVSALRPHKNQQGLIEAIATIPRERRPVAVMPGYSTAYEQTLRDRARSLGVEDDVRFPGWISNAELEGLYAHASAFVFPSLYEGFGLPVLEAMQRGVPVACSNTSSLPELAGDAAVLFDPTDPRAIAAAIEKLLDDPDQAQRLRERGFQRAANFTWAKTAEATLASYRRAFDRNAASARS